MKYPSHLAVIPDGNRRYAKENHLPLEIAYVKGFEKVNKMIEWLSNTPVQTTTFWAMSLDNFTKRSRAELSTLFKIMDDYLEKTINAKEIEKVKVNFFGRKELLPKNTLRLMNELEQKSRKAERELNFAIAYSGEDEIAHATLELAKDIAAKKITAEDVQKQLYNHLYYPKQVDLVIRTGDTQRLSGFLPLQTGYSELYFSQKMWPAFEQSDLQKALEYYDGIERRFGK